MLASQAGLCQPLFLKLHNLLYSDLVFQFVSFFHVEILDFSFFFQFWLASIWVFDFWDETVNDVRDEAVIFSAQDIICHIY